MTLGEHVSGRALMAAAVKPLTRDRSQPGFVALFFVDPLTHPIDDEITVGDSGGILCAISSAHSSPVSCTIRFSPQTCARIFKSVPMRAPSQWSVVRRLLGRAPRARNKAGCVWRKFRQFG